MINIFNLRGTSHFDLCFVSSTILTEKQRVEKISQSILLRWCVRGGTSISHCTLPTRKGKIQILSLIDVEHDVLL